jgi:uncharacterized protein (TIRG00374 family)
VTPAGDQGPPTARQRTQDRHLYRHPADVARLVLNVALLGLLLLLSWLAPQGMRTFTDNLLELVGELPRPLAEGLVGVIQLIAVVLPVAIVISLLWHGRFVLLGLLAVAATLGAATMAVLTHVTRHAVPVEHIGFERVESWFIGGQFPSSAYICGATAVLICASPWLSYRWRRAGYVFMAAALVGRVMTATEVPIRLGLTLTAGAAIGSLVLVVLGGPRRRVDVDAVATALGQVGLPPRDVHRTSGEDDVPVFAVTGEDGHVHTATVIGRDQRDSDLLLYAWRILTRRSLEQVSPVGSPSRAVRREALSLSMFGAAGVVVPKPVAVAETDEEAAVLVTDQPDGIQLADLPEDDIDDALLDTLWQQVARLQQRRMAHRALDTQRIVIADGCPILVAPRQADLQASDEVLGADVAQVLACLAATVGPERAVASAARQLPVEALVRAVPLVQPAVFTGATRRAYRGDKQAVTDLRDHLADVAGVEHVEVAPVSRITVKGVVSLVGSVVLGYYLLSLASNWDEIWTAFAEANLAFAVPIIVLISVTYVTGALTLHGAVMTHLSLTRTTAVMFGQEFLNRFTPADAGGMAMRVRYLQLNGEDTTVAAAAVGLTSAANGFVQAILLVVFLTWGGTSDRLDDFEAPDWEPILIAILVVGLAISVLLYTRWGRRIVRPIVAGAVGKIRRSVGTLARDPSKLMLLFGGATAGKLLRLGCFWLSVLAFGVDMSFPRVAALYMIANTVGSAVPSPGGVGGIEAAFTAVLIGYGVDSASAAASVLFFRVLTFWLVTVPDYVFLQYIQRKGIV